MKKSCWPDAHQEQLLIAALDPGPKSIAAWQNWIQKANLDNIDPGSYGLLPVLYKNLHERAGHSLLDRLKAIYRESWVTNQRLWHKAGLVLTKIQDAGIPVLLLKGISLALKHYPTNGMRAMKDLDFMVPYEKRHEAVKQLNACGWKCKIQAIEKHFDQFQSEEFEDAFGNRLDLHWNLSRYDLGPGADEAYWRDAQIVRFNCRDFLTLHPVDLLLHVSIHGCRRSQEPIPPFRWLADAYRIIASTPDMDWEKLIRKSREKNASLPVQDTLFYLHEKLGLSIPKKVLEKISRNPVTAGQRLFFDSARQVARFYDRWLELCQNARARAEFFSHSHKLKNVFLLSHLFAETHTSPLRFIPPLLLGVLMAVLDTAAVSFLLPLLAHMTRDLSGINNSASEILFWIVMISLLFLFKNILGYSSMFLFGKELTLFAGRLRQRIFQKYLSFGKQFYDQKSLGQLNAVLIHFIDKALLELNRLHHTAERLLMLAGYLILMLFISWKLTLWAFVLFAFNYRFVTKWLRSIREDSLAESQSQMSQSRNLSNVLMTMPLVKAYGNEALEEKQFENLSSALQKIQFRLIKKQILIAPAEEMLAMTGLMLLAAGFCLFPALRVEGWSVFLVYLFLLRRTLANFGAVNNCRLIFSSLTGSLSEIDAALNNKNKFFIPDGTKIFSGLQNKIEFCNLNFAYADGMPVLNNVSFVLPKGKITALVGASGAGKSTLAHLLMRFYDCPSGSIKMDGEDIRDYKIKTILNHVAFVAQDPLLFHDTIERNLTYGLDRQVSEAEMVKVCRQAQFESLVMSLPQRFQSFIGDRGVQLSGGEKQRLAIARALLKNAEILIMDEMTSSLDSVTERQIQEVMANAFEGRTVLMIAHRFSTLRQADQIIVIENGCIVEQGETEELLQRQGRFHAYWEQQKFQGSEVFQKQ